MAIESFCEACKKFMKAPAACWASKKKPTEMDKALMTQMGSFHDYKMV